MEDIRSDKRTPVDVEIRFRYPMQFNGKMKDFAFGGMGAEIPVSVDVDSSVELEICEGRFLITGQVQWTRIEDGRVRIGVKFKESQRDLIEHVKELKGNIT